MNEETKERLKNIPIKRCSICRTQRSYTNPLEKCSVCGEWFCYDHLKTSLEKNGVVNYCDGCYSTKFG